MLNNYEYWCNGDTCTYAAVKRGWAVDGNCCLVWSGLTVFILSLLLCLIVVLIVWHSVCTYMCITAHGNCRDVQEAGAMEEEESLGTEKEGEEKEIENNESNRELVTLADGALTAEDVGKVEKKKCCRKCRDPFNSVVAIVIVISVFVLSLLISLIVVLIVKEPLPPFYTGRLQWTLAFSQESSFCVGVAFHPV